MELISKLVSQQVANFKCKYIIENVLMVKARSDYSFRVPQPSPFQVLWLQLSQFILTATLGVAVRSQT